MVIDHSAEDDEGGCDLGGGGFSVLPLGARLSLCSVRPGITRGASNGPGVPGRRLGLPRLGLTASGSSDSRRLPAYVLKFNFFFVKLKVSSYSKGCSYLKDWRSLQGERKLHRRHAERDET